MNHLTANDQANIQHELMLHVERIVRPVRASQRRRLRMRNELLAHLQAALAEELRRLPDDELAAIENAKQRLGEPVELTKRLQQTVSLWERVLLAKAPLGRRVDELERRMDRLVYGTRSGMTNTHGMIVAALVGLIGLPLYTLQIVRDVLTRSGRPVAHVELFLIGMLVGAYLLMFLGFRFVFAAAAPEAERNLHGLLWRGLLIFALQIGMACFATAVGADRAPTIGEAIVVAAVSLAMLLVAGFVGWRIGIRRRPYDEWMQLDIAE